MERSRSVAERTVRVRPRRSGWRWLFRLVLLIGAVPILLAAGWVWFGFSMPSSVADRTTRTDAIVVLAGGTGRLEEGVALLRRDLAPVLFLSGVNRKVEKREILRLLGNPPPNIARRIVLGYRAEHTRGNADETVLWVNSQNFRSIRLVTANYHMRRSLLELSRKLNDNRIVANPVFPPPVTPGRWWRSRTGLAVVTREYIKYLLALFYIRID